MAEYNYSLDWIEPIVDSVVDGLDRLKSGLVKLIPLIWLAQPLSGDNYVSSNPINQTYANYSKDQDLDFIK